MRGGVGKRLPCDVADVSETDVRRLSEGQAPGKTEGCEQSILTARRAAIGFRLINESSPLARNEEH